MSSAPPSWAVLASWNRVLRRVHTTVESERIYAITQGEKRLLKASERVQTDHVFSANQGRTKGQFGQAGAAQKAYMDM